MIRNLETDVTDEASKTRRAPGTKTREYLRTMPTTWWLRRKTYFLFMVRELTCVAVGGYAVLLLILAASAHDHHSCHSVFMWMKESRVSAALHAVAFPIVVYHSVTWFNLTPKAMVVWRGEEKLNPRLIAGSNYVVWLVVSILVAWIVLG